MPSPPKKPTRKAGAGKATGVLPPAAVVSAAQRPLLKAYLQAQVPLSRIAAALGLKPVELDEAIKRDAALARMAEAEPAAGLANLAMSMFVAARGGNVSAQIFRAKNYLGMSEKVDTTSTNTVQVLEVPTPMSVDQWEAAASAMQEAAAKRRASDEAQ